MATGAIARLEKDGKFTALADKFEGKRFNSPNDLCFKSNGDLYFTDPPYGMEKNWDDPARELDFCGVYRLTPTEASVAADARNCAAQRHLLFAGRKNAVCQQ